MARETAMRLYVGNLAYSTTDDSLRARFAPFGVLLAAMVMIDRLNGRSRGFGFVEYTSAEEAQRAIEAMHGSELEGRVLFVSLARERGAGGGRGSSHQRLGRGR
jgi:cold-inducible RNA-binding protein